MAQFWTASNVSTTSGSAIVTVNTGDDVALISPNSFLQIGTNQFVEVKIVNTSASPQTIELFVPWNNATASGQSAIAAPTKAEIKAAADEIRALRVVYEGLANDLSVTATPDTIVVRDASSRIKTATPSAAEDAVNKGYLGSAATANVTASDNDTTSQRLMRVGDFGLGELSAVEYPKTSIDDPTCPSGLYRLINTNPSTGTRAAGHSLYGYIQVLSYDGTNKLQIATDINGKMASRLLKPAGNTDWVDHYTSGNSANVTAPTTSADFFALAEKRIRDNAGSGFAEWGTHLNNGTNAESVNEGITAPYSQPNVLYFGRAVSGQEGVSRTDYPLCNVNGIPHRLTYVGSNNTGWTNQAKLPAAPDGTKTYDPATGDVVQHASSAIAFAAETTTNKVITSRQDFMLLETWHEKVSDKDVVYPLGNVQYGATSSPSGIGLNQLSGIVGQGYSAFGEWDTVTGGYGRTWSDLSETLKNELLQDPENNLYMDNDELIQVRYRIRVIEGLGDTWLSLGSTDNPRFDENSYLEPQGTLVVPKGYTGNTSTDTRYRKHDDLENLPVGTYGTRVGATFTTDRAHNGLCFAIPIAVVQRRNQGAYHPSFNPEGTSPLYNIGHSSNNVQWYVSTAEPVTSESDCFAIGTTLSGNQGALGTSSGRPDAKLYDSVYASDVEDLRMSSVKLPLAEIREKYKRMAIAGEVRGFEGVPFLNKFDTQTRGSQTATTLIDVADTSSYNVGDILYFQIVENAHVYDSATVTNVNSSTRMTLNKTVEYDLGSLIVHYTPQTHKQAAPSWTDIIGDPANILATFPNGVEGQWIPVIPDGSGKDWKLNRKSLDASIINTYSTDNGVTWASTSSAITITENARLSVPISASDVALYQYETQAHFTEDSVNSTVLDLGGVFATSDATISTYDVRGVFLHSSLTGKVGTVGEYTNGAVSEINIIKHARPTGTLLSYQPVRTEYIPTHNTLTIDGGASNAAVKTLDYLSSEYAAAKMCYAYKEMVYNVTWGDNNQFEITDNQSTLTDDNGATVLYGTASFETQYFIVEK